jgi:excisionase family DNA binding protein
MPQRIINLDDYYDTPAQCCAELGWSMPGLYRRIQQGEIETVKVGRTRLIKRQPKAAG